VEKIQEALAKARARREAATGMQQASYAAPSPVQTNGTQADVPTAPDDLSDRIDARWTALPEFIPAPALLKRNKVMTASGGKAAADFDTIRTRLLQMQRANGWKRIAVTSPGPGCGKSTLVLNLAFSLARQRDQRTIVCEMDLRRPTLTKMMGHKGGHDFSAVLEGKDSFEHNAFRAAPNLIFATNSTQVRNPSELLQGQGTARALDDITARYAPTVILFDLPPMLAVDDAMAFIARVDAVILVAAAEQTSIKQIDLCEREIASQTNVMGVVLNKCRYMDPEHSYGYGY